MYRPVGTGGCKGRRLGRGDLMLLDNANHRQRGYCGLYHCFVADVRVKSGFRKDRI